VMAISVISVSSDSSEESVGTPPGPGRVFWFGRIPTTIPDTTPTVTPPTTHVDTALTPTKVPTVSPVVPPFSDHTPTSPDYSPASDTESDPSEDPSSDHISPLPAISPFLSSTDDSSDSDTHESPPSQDPYETAVAQWKSCVAARSSPSSSLIHQILPAPPGLPRRQAVLSFGSLPTLRLASRYPSDSSSSDSSLGYAISDSLDDSLTATSARPSRKRCRSSLVPVSSHIRGALSPVRVDLSPPHKRIRDSDSMTDLEVSSGESSESSVPRETSLRDDVVARDSDEPYSEPEIDPEIQAKIDECIAYADALRSEGIDARVVVDTSARSMKDVRVDRVTHPMVSDVVYEPIQEGAVEVTYETLGDLVQRFHDHTEEISVHRVQAIESIQRDQGHMIVAMGLQSADLTMRNKRSGATMTREAVNELIDRRVAEALEARDTARNLEPLMEDGGGDTKMKMEETKMEKTGMEE
ncbi:hypothetical protein Tco_0123786, partial [Tanacetum coccineum]